MKIRVWNKPDGTVAVTTYSNDPSLGMSEQEIIDHADSILSKTYSIQDSSLSDEKDLPADRNYDKWEVKDGNVNFDSNKQTPQEKLQADRQSVVSKLKLLGLTDDEIKVL